MEQGNRSTLQELAEIRSAAKHTAKTGEGGSADDVELPAGAVQQAVEESKGAAVEAAGEVTEGEVVAEEKPEEPLIKIGNREFKSQEEAFKYAEELEEEKLRAELYSQGVKDALQSNRQAEPEPVVEEENFEEKFYANPKEALAEVKNRAVQDAVALIKAETAREKMWSDFFDKYPDLDGERKLCEMTLNENWSTIGNMTDLPKAMDLLAQKTRAIFQGYIERSKPRTELPARRGQAVSAGNSARGGVTPQKKEAAPLTMVEQLKLNRNR